MSNTQTTAPELFTVNPEPSYTPIFDELDAHYASLPVNVSSAPVTIDVPAVSSEPVTIDAPVVAIRDTEPRSTAPVTIDAPVVTVRDTEPRSTAPAIALEIRGVLYLLALGGLGYAGLRAVSFLQYGA